MTPVHVVSGALGSGKTTLLQALIPRLPGKSAILVNDFGEARIDATLLEGSATLTDIPGGCVCCTAPEGLGPAVHALLDEVKPDRIFIEPSGLARPQDVVDMLVRGGLPGRIVQAPTLVLVDVARLAPDAPDRGLSPEMLAQIEAADVLVGSRVDLADHEQLGAFDSLAAALWPPPMRVVTSVRGGLDPGVLAWREGHGPRAVGPAHDHVCDDACAHVHAPAPGHGHRALSRVWPPETIFSWDALHALITGLPLARLKGLFRGDIGWFRADVAGGRVHLAATGYRRDSRVDGIVEEGPQADEVLAVLAAGLEACRLESTTAPLAPGITLVALDGTALALTRAALAGLPGQVADVGAFVPGRRGSAVPLREVLALAVPPPAARFVLSAADGMTSAPTPIAGVEAWVVHSLEGEALPGAQGGPFRVLASPGGPGACASVKDLVRVRILPGEP